MPKSVQFDRELICRITRQVIQDLNLEQDITRQKQRIVMHNTQKAADGMCHRIIHEFAELLAEKLFDAGFEIKKHKYKAISIEKTRAWIYDEITREA